MKKLLKLKTLGLEKVFYIFATWNFINVVAHITSFYIPFISEGVDYWFYGIEIILFSFLSLNIKRMHCAKFNSFYHLINLYVFCDIVELLYSNISDIITLSWVLKTGIGFLVFFILFDSAIEDNDLKHYLDNDHCDIYKRIKFYWKLIYISILIGLWGIADTKKLLFLYLIYFSVLCRFACSIYGSYMIKGLLEFQGPINKYYYFKPFYELVELKNPELIKKTFKWFGTVIIAVFVIGNGIGLYKINKFSNHEDFFDKDGVISESIQELYDFRQESEEVYTYSINNGFSEQSMFFQEKYGIVNVKTGFDSGAIYDGRPCFDGDGISPDYNGHFINLDGEVVFDLPLFVTRKNATRQSMLNKSLSAVYDIDIPHEGHIEETGAFRTIDYDYISRIDGIVLCKEDEYHCEDGYKENQNRHYFDHGIGFYYSEMHNAFGVISDKGKVLNKPEFYKLSIADGYNIFGVQFKDKTENAYNCNLEPLIDDKYENVGLSAILTDTGLVMFYCNNVPFDWSDERMAVADNGMLEDCDYCTLDISGDKPIKDHVPVVINKHIGRDKISYWFYQGKELFEAEKYKAVVPVYNNDGVNIFACLIENDDYIFLNEKEEKVFPGEYSKFGSAGDGYVFIESTEQDHEGEALIGDIYGNIVYTGYNYVDLDMSRYDINVLEVSEKGSEQSDFNRHNYIDSQGNLLEDWHIRYDKEYIAYDIYYNYIIDLNENNELTIWWFEENGKEIFHENLYSGYEDDEDFGAQQCEQLSSKLIYGDAIFWRKNELGTYDLFNYKGRYINTVSDKHDIWEK